MIQGTIIRVAGPVVDVQFTAGRLPALQEALTVTAEGTERTMEVTQHVNETTVRCIMLSASEGLGKGMPVEATGHGLTAPVGEGKVSMILYVSKDLHGRFTAPALIREVAAPIAGSGGGRPDQAQAGGTNPAGIDEALDVLKAKIGG